MTASSPPKVLSIAGVDPSGGAGVLADVKAMSALGAYACAVIAALTAQNTRAVTGIWPVPPDFVAQQIDTLFADVAIDSVKVGMLGEAPVIERVAERLAHWRPRYMVVDPVMVAKSGDALLAPSAVEALRSRLLPLATVITPNLPEAAVLLAEPVVTRVEDMPLVAARLWRLIGAREGSYVLLKGGHLPGEDCTDVLFDGVRVVELPAARIATRNTHGTGCTLSAALAALLPQSPDVPTAVHRAKAYLGAALARADELGVGAGHGPVHHFHAWWPSC
ncbi:MAG TPA: bifunctional hydroxymethylpyrimidine kinase/phosphomethylpyrimidine kinase [Burkholderiaceae bacterium]|jgi:hydroxymethylpyrimidine/phosphomethylpyrimidine kinase|nr:bifunctional hydroxymethylpyrimidine kinase/phosphomethylpyrimidine kinase [Burkholderiaceae bacterium]